VLVPLTVVTLAPSARRLPRRHAAEPAAACHSDAATVVEHFADSGGARLGSLAIAFAAATVLLGAGSAGGVGETSGGHALDPRLFAPGSCVAFAPTSGDRHRTVFIDAGHGGPDPGAVGVTAAGSTVTEASETLRVALDTLPLLRAAGYRVVLSRTTDGAVARPAPGDLAGGVFTGQGVHRDLVARDRCANRAMASVLVGVYFDASESASVRGSLTLYDAARPFWRANRRLAQLLQGAVLAQLHLRGWSVPDDGVHTDVGYGSAVTNADRGYGHLLILGPAKPGYFSSPSTMPGALIEPLFLTDSSEASIADSRGGQQATARGLAIAVQRYFAAHAS
jgi:N-acetylmuramoyl-L-alanine amidase